MNFTFLFNGNAIEDSSQPKRQRGTYRLAHYCIVIKHFDVLLFFRLRFLLLFCYCIALLLLGFFSPFLNFLSFRNMQFVEYWSGSNESLLADHQRGTYS